MDVEAFKGILAQFKFENKQGICFGLFGGCIDFCVHELEVNITYRWLDNDVYGDGFNVDDVFELLATLIL